MKVLRMAICTAALVLGAASVAQAQGGMAPAGGMRGPGRMLDRLLTGVNPTPAQQAQIDSIAAAYRAQMPPMTRGTPPDSATRAKRLEVMQQETAAIRAILTPDQQKTFDKNVEDMRSRMGRRRPNG